MLRTERSGWEAATEIAAHYGVNNYTDIAVSSPSGALFWITGVSEIMIS